MSQAKKIRKALREALKTRNEKLALAKKRDGVHTTQDREEIASAHPVYLASKLGLILRYKLTYRSVGPKSMARFARRHGIKASQIEELVNSENG